ARRLALVARAFAGVTPCEVERVEGASVILRDEALVRGFGARAETRYRVELIDERGGRVAEASYVPRGPLFAIAMPASAPRYAVLRVTTTRAGREAPRAMEVHLTRRKTGWA